MEHRTFHRILAAIIAVLIVLAGYGVYYVNDYHHAINVGNAIQSNPTVKVTDIEDGWLFDGPGTTTAMVFYPGAKVEASAYAPLMQETAASGIDCFLMKMPANLAIFGINRADVVRSDIAGYSYDHWYIAGHSLGGTMAANYISVVTYKRNATRSPAATHPFIINMLPKSKTDTYIAPSKAWVVALKTAIR